mmetsp:Transcript_29900/g.77280  ORF Transcript_29900/g.77280 Transcript_29900/m.77280 type:complete len:204 (-) Transcript_29900:77-688(-)
MRRTTATSSARSGTRSCTANSAAAAAAAAAGAWAAAAGSRLGRRARRRCARRSPGSTCRPRIWSQCSWATSSRCTRSTTWATTCHSWRRSATFRSGSAWPRRRGCTTAAWPSSSRCASGPRGAHTVTSPRTISCFFHDKFVDALIPFGMPIRANGQCNKGDKEYAPYISRWVMTLIDNRPNMVTQMSRCPELLQSRYEDSKTS